MNDTPQDGAAEFRGIPLGAPIRPIDPDTRTRYMRQTIFPGIGLRGQERLAAARILVVGAGGLGSPVVTYLARAGVGSIGVVDDDVVEVSNLHRQFLHSEMDSGTPKTSSAAKAVAEANPDVTLIEHRVRFSAENADEIVRGYDLVVDATDGFAARYAIADATTRVGLPCVWGAVIGLDGQVSTFWSRAPQPFALRDLWPVEPPASELSCATAGVLGPLCGVVGSWMAVEAIKLIVGLGRPLVGRLLSIDGASSTTVEIEVRTAHSEPARTPVPRPVRWMDVDELHDALSGPISATVVDVRERDEHERISISGTLSVPLSVLGPETIGVLPDGPLIVHCKTDIRARQARDILLAAGRDDVTVVRGGIDAWLRRFPVDHKDGIRSVEVFS
ncbi:MAG: ThiF family adenylyltransferase [Rhodococcus erythropolis]